MKHLKKTHIDQLKDMQKDLKDMVRYIKDATYELASTGRKITFDEAISIDEDFLEDILLPIDTMNDCINYIIDTEDE